MDSAVVAHWIFRDGYVGNRIYAMQNQGGYGDLQTTVSSFDLSTGAIIWSYTGNFVFPSQPGVGGGFVTFVGETLTDSRLYMLDAANGSLRYTVPIPEGETSMMPTPHSRSTPP